MEVRSPSARVSLGEQGAEDQALSLAESNVSSVIDNQAIFNEWTKLASQLKANNPILGMPVNYLHLYMIYELVCYVCWYTNKRTYIYICIIVYAYVSI